MTRPARAPLPLHRIFAAPALIALLTLLGLAVALTGEGVRDALAWACLGVPIAAVLWAVRARRN